MGEVKETKPVLYFSSIIYGSGNAFNFAQEKLLNLFGEIEEITEEMSFSHTKYYEDEMGLNLKRKFVLFKSLKNREDLPEVKIKTNEIEKEFSFNGKRTFNIDPGYISLENVILATTKNYTHRIYIGKGIYADLTLIFKSGTFRPLEWTYPDYASEPIVGIFNKWRKVLKERLRKEVKC
ncbi:MAG: DUF4416 family protein [Deltaproteobacteria bacterium]|nr:DUF4416 family protein [Deltaproteobacteria bacterium]